MTQAKKKLRAKRYLTAAFAGAVALGSGAAFGADAPNFDVILPKDPLTLVRPSQYQPVQEKVSVFGATARLDIHVTVTNWQSMLKRQKEQMQNPANAKKYAAYLDSFKRYAHLPLLFMAQDVNANVQKDIKYSDTFYKDDAGYFATPFQTITNKTGDCKDFAVLQYAILRHLGVPEERLLIANVNAEDSSAGTDHTVLLLNISAAGAKPDYMVLNDSGPVDDAVLYRLSHGANRDWNKPYKFYSALNQDGVWLTPLGKKPSRMCRPGREYPDMRAQPDNKKDKRRAKSRAKGYLAAAFTAATLLGGGTACGASLQGLNPVTLTPFGQYVRLPETITAFGAAARRRFVDPVNWDRMYAHQQVWMQNPEHAKNYAAFLDSFKRYAHEPLLKMAQDVNAAVLRDFKYNENLYADPNYNAPPAQTVVKKAGDCKAFAILQYAILRHIGVPENRLAIAGVNAEGRNWGVDHDVLIFNVAPKGAKSDFVVLNDSAPVESVSRYARPQPKIGWPWPYKFYNAESQNGVWLTPLGATFLYKPGQKLKTGYQ